MIIIINKGGEHMAGLKSSKQRDAILDNLKNRYDHPTAETLYLDLKKEMPALYKTIGERYKALDSWSMYLITAYEQTEEYIGRKADKNRKIYNGMLKTYFYQFMGPRPPKKKPEGQ